MISALKALTGRCTENRSWVDVVPQVRGLVRLSPMSKAVIGLWIGATGGADPTGAERIGVSRFVVSKVLNHSSDAGDGAAVTAVYDRNAYLPEKRKALDSWAELLQVIVSAEPA